MQITDRDIEILKFINEFGFCEMPQIERKFGLRNPRGYKVIKRLIEAGLVVHEYVLRNKHGVYRLTRRGSEFTDLPMLKFISLGSYLHQLAIVNVHLDLMQRFPDAIWISERRLKRSAFLKASFVRYGHVADGMLIFPDGKKIAIEVELTMKSKNRLEKILTGYALNRAIDGVWYFCAEKILEKMRRVMDWRKYMSVFEFGLRKM